MSNTQAKGGFSSVFDKSAHASDANCWIGSTILHICQCPMAMNW